MKQSVIFDMDGTLCDVQAIRHYVRGDKQNFDAFHKASLWCPPNQDVLDMARGHVQLGHKIIVVTARDEKYRDVTEDWLAKYPIPHDVMYMRPWGDPRKDRDVKADILELIRSNGDYPYLAYDDNPHVIAFWETAGIAVSVVPGWDATPLEESLGILTPDHV
jgi:phosphoglycolate phosphatase-like HAD superfamily hydrolase